jgi:hypothetical protein
VPRKSKPTSPRTTAKSLVNFVAWVEEVSDFFRDGDEYFPVWFRGVGNQSHALLPGLYRTKDGLEAFADSELRSEFMRRALPFANEMMPRNDWEWYFLMQHFRVPTRLLDWSDAALVALHFSLQASAGQKTRPAVWALNPFAVNAHTQFEGALTIDRAEAQAYLPKLYTGRERLPERPIAIDPPLVARRMLVQHSHFTMHGRHPEPLDKVSELCDGTSLLKIVIELDSDDRDYLAWQLRLCGISDTTIFPDLEGLARELSSEYGIVPGPPSTGPNLTLATRRKPPKP